MAKLIYLMEPYSQLYISHRVSPHELRHNEFGYTDTEVNRVLNILCEGSASSNSSSISPKVNNESHEDYVEENINENHEALNFQDNLAEEYKKNKVHNTFEEDYIGCLHPKPTFLANENEKPTNRNSSSTDKSTKGSESRFLGSKTDTNKKILELENIHSSKRPCASNLSEFEIICNEEVLGSQLDPSKRGNLKKSKYKQESTKLDYIEKDTKQIPEEDKSDYIKPLGSEENWLKSENSSNYSESEAISESKSNHFYRNSKKQLFKVHRISSDKSQDSGEDDLTFTEQREKDIIMLKRKSTHPRSFTLAKGFLNIIDLSNPANIEFADKHSKANKIMKLSEEDIEEAKRCECCNMLLDQKQFPLFRNTYHLKQLGSSFPLYFHVVKLMIICHLACFFIACLPCMIENRMAARVDGIGSYFPLYLITPASFGTSTEISIWQPILHVIVCVILMLFYLYILKTIQEKSIEIDIQTTTPQILHSYSKIYRKNIPEKN